MNGITLWLYWLLPMFCISATIGFFVGNMRGRAGLGAFWGFLFGPAGWVLVMLTEDPRPTCPLCYGTIPTAGVTRCKNCGADLTEWRKKEEQGSKALSAMRQKMPQFHNLNEL